MGLNGGEEKLNYHEYVKMRRRVLHDAADAMEDAAKRNEHKDEVSGPLMLGWPLTYKTGWRSWGRLRAVQVKET